MKNKFSAAHLSNTTAPATHWRGQSTAKPQTSQSLKYTVIFSLLMIVGMMLVLAAIYLPLYRAVEQTTRNHLIAEVIRLNENPATQWHTQRQRDVWILSEEHIFPAKMILSLDQKPRPLSTAALGRLNATVLQNNPNQDMMATLLHRAEGRFIVAVPFDKQPFKKALLHALLYLSIVVALLMLMYGFFLSARAKRRLNLIDEAAQSIMNGDMQKRIPITATHDEYAKLSLTLNAMLDKNAMLMRDLKQVNNNIAHDLKTPLNRLRSRLEVTLLKPRDIAEYQATLADSIEDVDHLVQTFNALLLMGNLESNSRNYQLKPTQLDELLDTITDLYTILAEEKSQTFSTAITAGISVSANAKLFSQAISNLIDNAIKYTPAGGKIHLSLQQHGGMAVITLTDNGPGIPASKREVVFDRFTRLDESRHLPGTGLGMSLVRAILGMHHANIQLHDNQPGLRVEIRLRVT